MYTLVLLWIGYISEVPKGSKRGSVFLTKRINCILLIYDSALTIWLFEVLFCCHIMMMGYTIPLLLFFVGGGSEGIHTRWRKSDRGKMRNHPPGEVATPQLLFHSPLRILVMYKAKVFFKPPGQGLRLCNQPCRIQRLNHHTICWPKISHFIGIS